VLFWKIALQILAVAIALLVNTLDYVTYDKRTRKFKKGRRVLFSLSVVFLVGSIIVLVKDESSKNNEVLELKNQLNTMGQHIKVTEQYVTGGESFFYVNLVSGGMNDRLMLIAINEGNHPLYDISFRMWDPADYGAGAENLKTIEDFEKNAYNIDVGNLPPHSTKTLGRIQLPNSDAKNFEVTIIARNGIFNEQIRLRRVEGDWKVAYRVHAGFERNSSNKLLERSDPKFPRGVNGQIKWE
jgi:hypothetical protein